MLGVGLDNDGHKRLTSGPNFVLVGGSQETHEVMTEKAIKINEKLAASGKQLEEVSHERVRRHRPVGRSAAGKARAVVVERALPGSAPGDHIAISVLCFPNYVGFKRLTYD